MGNFFTTYNDKILIIGGGMRYEDGSHIVLIGKDSEKNVTDPSMVNGFAINTGEDETYGASRLIGKVDRTLTWNNNYLSDIAITDKSISNNGYISLACGFIIQWGLQANSAGNQTEIIFPIAFNHNSKAINITVQNTFANYKLTAQLRVNYHNRCYVSLNKDGNTEITEASYGLFNYIVIGY